MKTVMRYKYDFRSASYVNEASFYHRLNESHINEFGESVLPTIWAYMCDDKEIYHHDENFPVKVDT